VDAALGFACALAVENRITEPTELKHALQPPLSNVWTNALPALNKFLADPASDWKPVSDCLAGL
jgi:hypothetical protein